MTKHVLSNGNLNLRGATIVVSVDGDDIFGKVITHTRNDHWIIDLEDGRRWTLHRSEFVWAWGPDWLDEEAKRRSWERIP